jgi:pimeloyl-ACP methyl ester carboxylesterase
MSSTTVAYLHGFASSSGGRKGIYLQQKFGALDVRYLAPDFNPTPRDFEYMTVTGMIGRLRQFLLDFRATEVRLIGSSMGGLVALNYAHRFPGVERLLLLAPALTYLFRRAGSESDQEWQRTGAAETYHFAFEQDLNLRYAIQEDGIHYQKTPPPPAPITIIHGRHDDVVPIGSSLAYAAQFPDLVRLIAIDAGHDINDHLGLIWDETSHFLLA